MEIEPDLSEWGPQQDGAPDTAVDSAHPDLLTGPEDAVAAPASAAVAMAGDGVTSSSRPVCPDGSGDVVKLVGPPSHPNPREHPPVNCSKHSSKHGCKIFNGKWKKSIGNLLK